LLNAKIYFCSRERCQWPETVDFTLRHCMGYILLQFRTQFLSPSAVQYVHFLVYPSITYQWTVPLILGHSYLVGKLTSSKIADTKLSGFF
jgi:hypothetical protein